ncbi:hypothetical protein D8674_037874 [Pyrus ussuriensis x Pyrus communis]|uniref:Uncharacterized protein n=1 Tax=Pyrus ussuriensis x Pyrus communis TaxID=2448454 RepID=A0A5N5HCK1_9ROSA|nr:hypothetical protein D8674_037874 [Pyrus ussuriensis x Pyrus communis]
MASMQNMKALATRFRMSISLSKKEKGGIKIDKKAMEEALLGKTVNKSGFIDQFTNLWREGEGISIRALGGAQWCKMERFRDKASEIDIEVLYTFKRLNAEYDLRGNSIMGRGNGQIEARGKNGSSSLSLGRCYDRLIDRGDSIAPEAGRIELLSHLDLIKVIGESTKVIQPNRDIDLNIPIMEVNSDVSGRNHVSDGIARGLGEGLTSQDSNLFNLLLIIEAVLRGGMKNNREDDGCEFKEFEECGTRVNKIQRSGSDQAGATYERSPRSQ